MADHIALNILKRHENDRLAAKILSGKSSNKNDVYRDHLGYWTIGYGHLITRDKLVTEHEARDHVGGPWSDERCERMLALDYEAKCFQLFSELPWAEALPDWPKRGLCNMAFQMGVAGVKGFPKMLAALRLNDWDAARAHALNSVWAKEQTPARAAEVAAMIGNEAIA
jgi:GH24 family phage-related lysozyme (muramidase)